MALIVSSHGAVYSCPVCGSKKITSGIEKRTISPMGAGEIAFDQVNNVCDDCGEEGDFAGENDPLVDDAIDTITTQRALESLKRLRDIRITPVYIERCLGLKIGTIRKWEKQNKVPRLGYALLRLIEHQPSLVEVAKNGYPPLYSIRERDPSVLAIDKIRMYANYRFLLRDEGCEYPVEAQDTAYRMGLQIYIDKYPKIVVLYPSIKYLEDHWK